MKDTIQINNPQEVLAYVTGESKLLDYYAEMIKQESEELSSLENRVSETLQLINYRKRGICVAIEQTRRNEDSKAKQQALKGLQEKLEQYEYQANVINQCNAKLIILRQDFMSLVKNSESIANNGNVVANKIQLLINRVIEAM